MNLCALSCERRERKEQKEEVGGRKGWIRGRSRKKRGKKWRKKANSRYDLSKINGMLSLKMKMEMEEVGERGLYLYPFFTIFMTWDFIK